jgi:hypothetical protein
VALKFGGITRSPRLDGAFAFKAMLDGFTEAWEFHPSKRWQSTCTFAGRRAHIRVVGVQAARKLTGALSHLMLACNSDGAQLKIDIWDESETSVFCPVEYEPVEKHISGSTWYVEFGLILGSPEDVFVGCQRPQIVAWLNRETQHVVVCIHTSENLPLYDLGKPLLFPLLLWHSDRGMEVIHACLISKGGQGVLLAGRGGIGKSTSALTCVEEGFSYLGDDYIALEAASDGSFAGHSLYSSTWLMADHLKRFPRLIPHAIYARQPDQEKSMVFLSDVFPDRLGTVAPIRALALPRVSGVPSPRVRRASRAEALFALAPKSLILLPSSGAKGLENLVRLAERVPCFWLDLSQDMSAVPDQIEKLIDLG